VPATRRLLVDANLLVLLVAGRVDEGIIGRHRRLREYSVADYRKLVRLLKPVSQVVVTPNTLTETSNLLSQHREPERSKLLDGLRCLIETSQEVVVASVDAARGRLFRRLGLSDAVLAEEASAEMPLLTVDLDLYLAVVKQRGKAAVHFRHLDLPR